MDRQVDKRATTARGILAKLDIVARHRTLERLSAAFVVYALALVFCLHAVVLHPGSEMTTGADGTNQLRAYWAASVQHQNPFDFSLDKLSGAPQGTVQVPATLVANGAIQTVFVWELHSVLGWVGAWNAFMLLGLLATGLATFAFLGWLGCSFGASLIGGFVFAFSPFALERAYAGHLGLLQNWVLVLTAFALLQLRDTRSLHWAILSGLAIALSFYQSAYIGLLAGFAALVFLLVELVRLRALGELLRTALLGTVTYLSTAVALIPVFVFYAREHSAFIQATEYGPQELYAFSASLLAYLLPSPRNPLFHWLTGIHPSDLTEETLYFGYATFGLALAAVLLAIRRDRWFVERRDRCWTVAFLAVLAVAAFVWSFPPSYRIDGITLTMPSASVGLVSSIYRVLSRFGLLAGFALTVLAALGLSALASRPGRRWHLLTPLVAAIVVLELLPGSAPVFDSAKPPAWVAWLASQPRGIVASYPWITGPSPSGDLFYQLWDHDPAFDVDYEPRGYDPATRDEGIRLLARDLWRPITGEVLTTEGVRYVVVDQQSYLAAGTHPPTLYHRQYTLLKRFGDIDIYSVHARTINIGDALAANISTLDGFQDLKPPGIAYGGGFNIPEPFQGTTSRWMVDDGKLEFHNTSGALKLTLSGVAFSNGENRTLELLDPSGRVVARQTIPTDAVHLTLGPFVVPHGFSTMTLVATPGPDVLGANDPREASVFLEPFSESVMPSYIVGS